MKPFPSGAGINGPLLVTNCAGGWSEILGKRLEKCYKIYIIKYNLCIFLCAVNIHLRCIHAHINW
jgi:hypothetical protein